MKIRIAIFFFIGFVAGAVYWLLSTAMFGKYEPWDYSLPSYWIVISVIGLFLGVLAGKRFGSAIFGLYAGQCIVAFLRSQPNVAESTPILTGLIAVAIYTSPAIVTGALGWLINKALIWRLLCPLEEKLMQSSILEVYHGIKVCDCNHNDMDNQDFLECTKKALDCIKKIDARIFNRVKNELDYIVNTELNSAAAYIQWNKRCDIDFGRYMLEKDYDWYFHHYMSSIIHESTHGYLFSKGIGYNKKNRGRVERICRNASVTFLKKTSFERIEDMFPKFDETRWHYSWYGSEWQKLKSLLQRMKESRKKECEAKQRSVG